jgi:ribosomal protein S18 acetylase RimI-like enzyme
MTFQIRRLTPADAEAYIVLRTTMLEQEPLAFLGSPGDDRPSQPDFLRERLADVESAIFGAYAPELVGAVGVYRHSPRKVAHKIGLWGTFVLPSFRGRGIARQLMLAALAHARSLPDVLQVALSVSETQPAARRLYESLGFQVWGSEPQALRHEGRLALEHHLSLLLPSTTAR